MRGTGLGEVVGEGVGGGGGGGGSSRPEAFREISSYGKETGNGFFPPRFPKF